MSTFQGLLLSVDFVASSLVIEYIASVSDFQRQEVMLIL